MVVSDFHVFIRDSLQHIDLMKKDHPGLPVFILGHSMVSIIPFPPGSVQGVCCSTGVKLQAVGNNSAHSRRNNYVQASLPFHSLTDCQHALPHQICLKYSQSSTFPPGSWPSLVPFTTMGLFVTGTIPAHRVADKSHHLPAALGFSFHFTQ